MSRSNGLNEASLPMGGTMARPRERVFFGGAVLVLVVALWSIPRLSFADGGVHTAMAHMLTELWTNPDSPLARYFVLNLRPEPNWFIYPPLVALLQLLDPHTAEKVLLTAYVVALPYSFRYAVTAVYPDNAPLAWYALPFVFAWPLNLGLYNFIFSLPWLFLALGYALRHWRFPTAGRVATLGGLGLATYFTHIASAIVMVAVLGVFGAWLLAFRYLLPERFKPATPTAFDRPLNAWSSALALGAAILPTALLIIQFAISNEGEEVAYGLDPWYRTKMLVYGNVLLSHTRWEALFSVPLALLPAGAAGVVIARRWARRKLLPRDGLLAAAIAVTVLSYLIPNNTSGGGLAVQRIQIYPYLLFMLWVGTISSWTAMRRVTVAVGAVGTAGLLAINLFYNHLHARYVAEFESVAPLLKPGSTMLLLDFTGWHHSPDGRWESFRLNFIGHPQSRFVIDRGVVDLNLFQASTPNFPVRYRFEADPYVHVRGSGAHPLAPPHDEFLRVRERADIEVDTVLVWGLTPERAAHPRAPETLDQLAEGYRLVHVSPNGWMRVYEREAP